MRLSIDIPAPVGKVWREAADLGSHVEWMADAVSIRFPGRRSGRGTRMVVKTRLGPFRVTDLLEVTAWEPRRRIGVVHRGAVSGQGDFLLEPLGRRATRFTWQEVLRFPWWLGGPLGALFARPILRRIWRGNLEQFRRRFL